jgi:hypothetical protein
MTAITPAVASATSTPSQALGDETLGMDVAALKDSVLRHLEYTRPSCRGTWIATGSPTSRSR